MIPCRASVAVAVVAIVVVAMNSCIDKPATPKMVMAALTPEGASCRPPVKCKGREAGVLSRPWRGLARKSGHRAARALFRLNQFARLDL